MFLFLQRSTSFHHELGDTISKSSAVGARRRLAVAPGSVVGAVLERRESRVQQSQSHHCCLSSSEFARRASRAFEL